MACHIRREMGSTKICGLDKYSIYNELLAQPNMQHAALSAGIKSPASGRTQCVNQLGGLSFRATC